MKKIKKIVFILGILSLSNFCFAFEIDDLEFNKNIKVGKEEIKIFNLMNNTSNEKTYEIYAEGDKNVNINPKIIILGGLKSKIFEVKVTGENSPGEYIYYLVIKEMNKKTNNLNINKIVRIKQKYKIIK